MVSEHRRMIMWGLLFHDKFENVYTYPLMITLSLNVTQVTFRGWADVKLKRYRSSDSMIYQAAAELNCWFAADSLGVGRKPDKVMGVCQLLLRPTDRAWSQGLVKALVLELAPNQTHDCLFSQKASGQIRWLTLTLLSIVGPRVRGMHFFSPPQVCLPPHVEFTHLTMFPSTSQNNK